MIDSWRIPATVYALAVLLNYPRELTQAGLFTTGSHRGPIVVHRFVSALRDGRMLPLLYALGTDIPRRDWFLRLGLRGYSYRRAGRDEAKRHCPQGRPSGSSRRRFLQNCNRTVRLL